VLSVDSLGGGGSDALEQFSGRGLILDLLFEEIGEAGNAFDLLSPAQQLNDTDDGSHDVLGFVVGGYVRHVLLELLGEGVKEGLDLAYDHNGRPLDQAMNDT
jgi:hypothetical protein